MHENLLLCLGLIMAVSFLVLIARKLSIAYPIFLVIAGLAFGFIPGIPGIHDGKKRKLWQCSIVLKR